MTLAATAANEGGGGGGFRFFFSFLFHWESSWGVGFATGLDSQGV